MRFEDLRAAFIAVLDKFAGGRLIPLPSQIVKVKGGSETVARVAKCDPQATAVVCETIAAVLADGAEDVWGAKGSPFRKAVVARLKDVDTPDEGSGKVQAGGVTKPAPEKINDRPVDEELAFKVSSLMRRLKNGLVSGYDAMDDLSLDDKFINEVIAKVAKKRPDADHFITTVVSICVDASTFLKIRNAIHSEARIRRLKVVRSEEKKDGVITDPVFAYLSGQISFSCRILNMSVQDAVKAAFDEMGPAPVSKKAKEIELDADSDVELDTGEDEV